MQSQMFSLNLRDIVKGLVTAVLGGASLAILAMFQGLFVQGFDVFSADWTTIARNCENAAILGAFSGFAGYISKNFLTNQDGKVGGII